MFLNAYRVYDPLSLIKILQFYSAKVETIKGAGSRYSKSNVAHQSLTGKRIKLFTDSSQRFRRKREPLPRRAGPRDHADW